MGSKDKVERQGSVSRRSTDDDVEGHIFMRVTDDGSDDVEGHSYEAKSLDADDLGSEPNIAPDDVEGHRHVGRRLAGDEEGEGLHPGRRVTADDEDDVEGHDFLRYRSAKSRGE